MKKSILYKLIAFLTFSALLASCSDTIENKASSEGGDSSAVYTVRGALSVGDALPSALANALKNSAQKSDSARSATTSFKEYSNEDSVNGITISATHGDTEITGEVTEADGVLSYSLLLNALGEWQITAELFAESDGSKTVILSGEETIIVERGSEESADIVLSPNFDNALTGSVSLLISNETESVTQAKWSWAEEELSSKDTAETFADGSLTFSFTQIPAGSHEVTLSFMDSDNKVLYVCKESITVYSGFVTDTWLGSSHYFSFVEEEEGKSEAFFVLTEDNLRTFALVDDITCSETDTPYILWNTYTKDTVEYDTSTFEATKREGDFPQGCQVFSSISEGQQIDYPLINEPSPASLRFGGEYIYYLDAKILYRFKCSFSGLLRDYSFVVDLETLCKNSLENQNSVQGLNIDSYTYTAGAIYFYWSWYDTDYNSEYYFSRYDLSTKALTSVKLSGYSDAHGSFLVTESGTTGTVYFINYQTVGKQNFTISDSSLTAPSDPKSFSLTSSALGNFYLQSSLTASDLMIKDNVLYVLVYVRGVSIPTLYTSSDGTTLVGNSNCLSAGGVVKVDLSSSTFGPSKWTNESYVLGLYTQSGCYQNEGTSEEPRYTVFGSTESPAAVMTPPLGEADSYFYGAQKFIAIKPKKLVIADDGGFVEREDSTKYKITPKNRVVTIDLENESISAVDVDVTFTVNIQGSSGSIMIQ